MAWKMLSRFQTVDIERLFSAMVIAFLKAEVWVERNEDGSVVKDLGTKVTLQVIKDDTDYGVEGVSNFGAQFVVKVRNQQPSAFDKLKPLSTELVIKDVERASIWGDYRNELSIIATLATKADQ